MLGGTSSINGMQFVHGPSENYNEWASLGNPGWDYESVLPYFKKFEGNKNETMVNNGRYHSATGPVKIESGQISPLKESLIATLRDAGVKFIDDINADKKLGHLVLQSCAYNGRRYSTAEAYLRSDKMRSNLHVIKHAFVNKILINKNNVAYGVEFTYKHQHKMRAYVNNEIIVSAGSVQSPPLLMRSGIGPCDHLEKHKIHCKADLPVGENYLNHLYVHFIFAMNISSSAVTPTDSFDNWYQYLVHNAGPLATSATLVGFIDTTNATGTPDIQQFYFPFQRGTSISSVEGQNRFAGLDRLNVITSDLITHSDVLYLTMSLLKPKSRGVIRLNKSQKAKIYTNYLTNPRDKEILVRAIKQQMNIMSSAPFRKIGLTFQHVPIPECDLLDYQSDSYWECYIKYVSSDGTHQVGSSKMGTDPMSVVDPRLKVYKIKGLRQMDAGV